MNIDEEIQWQIYEKRIKKLAEQIGTEEFKNNYKLQQDTYGEIIDLWNKQREIKPHGAMKEAKIKLVKQTYNYALKMNEVAVKSKTKYEIMKNKLIKTFKWKMKKHKVR